MEFACINDILIHNDRGMKFPTHPCCQEENNPSFYPKTIQTVLCVGVDGIHKTKYYGKQEGLNLGWILQLEMLFN